MQPLHCTQDTAGGGHSHFRGKHVLEPEQGVPCVKTPTPAIEEEVRLQVFAFYYDDQAKVYILLEGPTREGATLVDTAREGFVVAEFDPAAPRYYNRYKFEELPNL